MRGTMQNQWSIRVLEYHIESNLYRRKGKLAHNFQQSLSDDIKDHAIEAFKDEYLLDFLSELPMKQYISLTYSEFVDEPVDVISKILEDSREPLAKEEILEKVLKQRMVKENTILLNLGNRRYFLKDSQGRYRIKEA